MTANNTTGEVFVRRTGGASTAPSAARTATPNLSATGFSFAGGAESMAWLWANTDSARSLDYKVSGANVAAYLIVGLGCEGAYAQHLVETQHLTLLGPKPNGARSFWAFPSAAAARWVRRARGRT